MATINLTRKASLNKKKGVSVFTCTLDIADTSELDITTSADVYQLCKIPDESYIVRAEALVITANNAGTSAVFDLGFDGGDTLIDGGNLASAAGTKLDGGTNSVVPQFKTTPVNLTFTPTYTGTAPTAGKIHVVVEYIEFEKTNGEITNFIG